MKTVTKLVHFSRQMNLAVNLRQFKTDNKDQSIYTL